MYLKSMVCSFFFLIVASPFQVNAGMSAAELASKVGLSPKDPIIIGNPNDLARDPSTSRVHNAILSYSESILPKKHNLSLEDFDAELFLNAVALNRTAGIEDIHSTLTVRGGPRYSLISSIIRPVNLADYDLEHQEVKQKSNKGQRGKQSSKSRKSNDRKGKKQKEVRNDTQPGKLKWVQKGKRKEYF